MANLIVVEKVLEGAAFECNVLPHPNVASEIPRGAISLGDMQMDIMASRKLENFQAFLGSVGDEETIRIILLQIAHAVHHIHMQDRTHGNITMKNLRVSESRKKVVLVQSSKNTKSTSKHEDIRDLGKLFQIILQQKNISDKISGHLYLRMTRSADRFTSQEVLQHPYLWSTDKKLRFLSVTSQRTTNGGRLEKELKEASSRVFRDSNWIQALALKDETERRHIAAQPRLHGKLVMENTIVRLTRERSGNYDQRFLWSLVRFIRNQWEHYWEKKLQVQACFLFDPLEGYWQFFYRRYPDLFPVVYDIVKHVQSQFPEQNIWNVYFTAMSPNQDLPTN